MDTVCLWYTHVDDVPPARLAQYPALLSPDERERRQRFHFQRDRDLFLLSRALLRSVLARYLDRDPRRLRFAANPHGKPELAYPPATRLCFNLSHSDGMAVCGVARERELGVDVESVRRAVDDGVARSFFAPQEVAWLDSLDPDGRQEGFLALWTLKEAYLKARGRGLSLALDCCRFGLDPLRLYLSDEAEDDPSRWHLSRHSLGDYRLALVVERGAGGAPEVRLQPMVP